MPGGIPRGTSGPTPGWSATNCRGLRAGRRLTPHERTVLIFTALFHDSGKPLTSQVDPGHRAGHVPQARHQGGAPRPLGPPRPRVRPGDPRGGRPAGPVPRTPAVPPGKARPGPRGRLAFLARQQQAPLPVRPRRHPRPQDRRDGPARGGPAPLEAGRRGERLLRSPLSVRQRPGPVPVLPPAGAEPPLRPLRGLPLHGDDDVGPARLGQGHLAGDEPTRPPRRLARRSTIANWRSSRPTTRARSSRSGGNAAGNSSGRAGRSLSTPPTC